MSPDTVLRAKGRVDLCPTIARDVALTKLGLGLQARSHAIGFLMVP